MGPMLFLVILIPFTINGLAVRESFFVSFLGGLGVSADAAFATGFLFFLVTLLLSLPGAAIMAWESVRGVARPSPAWLNPGFRAAACEAERVGEDRARVGYASGSPRRAAGAGDVAAVVVTYNAMPWLERCLESLAGVERVVVDHGSSDGSVEARERPARR